MEPEAQVNKLFWAFPSSLQGHHKDPCLPFGTSIVVQEFLNKHSSQLAVEGFVSFSFRLWMPDLMAEVRNR